MAQHYQPSHWYFVYDQVSSRNSNNSMALGKNMADGNVNWKENQDLAQDLKQYVASNMQRSEILDFVKRDYGMYPWSIPTLDRRLRHFGVRYIKRNTPVADVVNAVQMELQGVGQKLGYRNMNLKLRTEHNICVPRKLVGEIMWELDPDGVQSRNVWKKKNLPKRPFLCDGPNWLFSLDGHDKMMGYQNSTFSLAIYGCLDTFSRKIMFLNVWDGNSEPILIGKFYVMYLNKSKVLPNYLRIDKGTENDVMASIHAYLRSKYGDLDDPTDSVLYGPSTTNKIERWWRDLHERMEKGLKVHLAKLLETHQYDPHNSRDRKILAYIFIPVLWM